MRKPAAITPTCPNLFTMGDMKMRKGRALAAPIVTVRPIREREAPRSPRNQNRNASRNPKNAPVGVGGREREGDGKKEE